MQVVHGKFDLVSSVEKCLGDGRAPKPEQGEHPRPQGKHRRQRGDQRRHLRLTRLHLHPRPQILVDTAQRLCCVRMVVLIAGHAGDLAQGGFVQLQADGHAFGHGSGVAHAAQADDVNAHAPVGGHLGRFQCVDARRTAAIAQQDDRRGVV